MTITDPRQRVLNTIRNIPDWPEPGVTFRDITPVLQDPVCFRSLIESKLPFDTLIEDYELEYGMSSVEIHTDAVRPGQRVLLVDDLIATGGTMLAASRLLQRLGANVVEAVAIVDLPDLGGSKALEKDGLNVFSVCALACLSICIIGTRCV